MKIEATRDVGCSSRSETLELDADATNGSASLMPDEPSSHQQFLEDNKTAIAIMYSCRELGCDCTVLTRYELVTPPSRDELELDRELRPQLFELERKARNDRGRKAAASASDR